MDKDKGGWPGRPAGVNEMMEPQRAGHDDGGEGDVHVPLGRVRLGVVQKRRNGFKCSKMRMLGKLGWKPCRTLGVIFLIRVK